MTAAAVAQNPGDLTAATGQAIASSGFLGAVQADAEYQRRLSTKVAATKGRWAKLRTWWIG
ncbi:MAG: hypothetical protein ACRC35_13600 [Angustibacter sp.]